MLDNFDLPLEYKAFLQQILDNPKIDHTPSKEVDQMWHDHILDTRSYQEMCENVFGRFLHHKPDGDGYCATDLEK